VGTLATDLRRGLRLPWGRALPPALWDRRHRVVLVLLAVHVVGLPVVALLHGDSPAEIALEVALIGALGLAGVVARGRAARALAATLGLLVASAALVESTGGLPQAHFHFFVVVAALALYEDWRPFALAIAFVFLWLGLSAALGFAFVDQRGSPWMWAAVHAGYVAAVSALALIAWRAGEGVRREIAAAEERYRTLVNALEEGVVLMEPDGRVAGANPAAKRIVGGEPAELDPERVVDADGRPLPPAVWPATITRLTGAPCTRRELGIRHPDATVTWVLVSTHALRSDEHDRGPYPVVVSFADITAQRRAVAELAGAHRELERRAVELERSNADLAQFAAVASHDLSEPLRTVASYLGLLRRRHGGELGRDADAFIDHAVDAAQRMRALIDDLLAYARVGRGEEARGAPVDLGETVAATLRSLAPAVAEARASVHVGPLPAVTGDAPLLGQLFQNLLANALKFRGERPLEVRVSAERARRAWRFRVADNGIGVDPAAAEQIFGMFQRGGEDEEGSRGGTGIGLAICRRIVERHGGRIWVEPTPGGGATFRFTIPDAPARRPGRFEPGGRHSEPTSPIR